MLFRLFFVCLLALLSTACQNEKKEEKRTTHLKLSTEEDFRTLDPRLVHTLHPVTALHLLYEGLMETGPEGIPMNGLAESVEISPDGSIYTFTLHPSWWSNGEALTAYDFASTWKSLLDPQFPSPHAYHLFMIKGAKEAKEGKEPLETVGIQAIDPRTLKVELVSPHPQFLYLLTTHFYFPVHASLREKKDFSSDVPTNGPFRVKSWIRNDALTVEKNPKYRKNAKIVLEEIQLQVLDNSTAVQLFQKNALDWVGSPLGTLPSDALPSFKKKGQLLYHPAAGTYFIRLNHEDGILSNAHIRQALSLSLDRQMLVEHVLEGCQTAAYQFVPPSFLGLHPLFDDRQTEKSRALLQEGMKELSLPSFPSLTFSYVSSNEVHRRIAQTLQQQWKKTLGIDIVLAGTESKMHYEKIQKKDYQLGLGSWFADIHHPLSFLEVFASKENGTNHTGWENKQYQDLLQDSLSLEGAAQENALKEAERLLIDQAPILPLFFTTYCYLKNPRLEQVYFSDLGWLDFKHAYFSEVPDAQ